VSIGRGGGAMSAEPSTGGEATRNDAQPTPVGAEPAHNAGVVLVRVIGAFGAVLGYGCLAAFLYLVSLQIYRWFREGEWTHFAVADAMRVWFTRCCVKDGDTGRLAAFLHWLDAPVDWLGLHKVFEILPASLLLFALSILGNSVFIYCRDWRDARRRPDTSRDS